jgi:hypothetical protein
MLALAAGVICALSFPVLAMWGKQPMWEVVSTFTLLGVLMGIAAGYVTWKCNKPKHGKPLFAWAHYALG